MTEDEERQEHEKSKDRQRRLHEPTDYDRAQPSEIDVKRVHAFLERENSNVIGSSVERKMGLFVAQQFNHGFDCGVAHVRAENGYEAGYSAAIEEMRKHLRYMEDERE